MSVQNKYSLGNKKALTSPKSGFNEEDDDQNFIKKDEPQVAEEKSEVKEGEEVQGIIWKLKNLVFPENNQQRNLAREVGGLEAAEKKEIKSVDVWDGRSEEVDKMGSTDVFNSSGMRSVVWKKKREKRLAIQAAKHALAAAGTITTTSKKEVAETFGVPPAQGYISRLKNLKQDRSNIHGNDGVGR